MLEEIKSQVLKANKQLEEYNLVTLTWGNVSGIDKKSGLVVIKPSGINYSNLTLKDLVVVDKEGNVVEGNLNPSSDTPTHLLLYKRFKDIGGVVHTHSPYATSWAQAKRDLPHYGTTHADYFFGSIPCTREMTKNEIEKDYELNTGKVITDTFDNLSISPQETPAVLVNGHAPFCWGENALKAIENSLVLEETAKMALWTEQINKDVEILNNSLLNKHYLRKHGENAYYGQG